jgi:C-terminal processing protease CtpA/Prc
MAVQKRKVGRPRKSEQKAEKVKRVPFSGLRTRMQLSEEEYKALKRAGYTAHWFNDQHGRIQKALAAGYVFVHPTEATSIGENQIGRENSDLAEKVSVIVSRSGDPVRAYLMKIKTKLYEEDQSLKEQALQATDEMIKAARVDGSEVEKSYGPGVMFN